MATKQTGFTLIELIVTMAVLAILLSVAIPNYQNMVLTNRMAAQANQVVTALNYARSEAVRRGTSTTVCSTSGGSACAATGTTNWSTGWMVFADANRDGTVGANETVLRVWPALNTGNTLTAGGLIPERVTYAYTGFATGFNKTFRLCDSRPPTEAREIIINVMGRSYTKKGTASCV